MSELITESESELNPQLIPVKKNAEIIRIEILTNVIKMFSYRGLILKENISKLIKSIQTISSDDSYKINLDVGINPDVTTKEYLENFNPKLLIIKIIHQKILGITKLPIIKEFIETNVSSHKLFIFDGISDKAKQTIYAYPNTEVFIESFLMVNIVEHIDSPSYELLTEDEQKEVLETYIVKRKELPKLLTSDPIVSYFNLKRGQIIRVISCSEQSGFAIRYRIVAKGAV